MFFGLENIKVIVGSQVQPKAWMKASSSHGSCSNQTVVLVDWPFSYKCRYLLYTHDHRDFFCLGFSFKKRASPPHHFFQSKSFYETSGSFEILKTVITFRFSKPKTSAINTKTLCEAQNHFGFSLRRFAGSNLLLFSFSIIEFFFITASSHSFQADATFAIIISCIQSQITTTSNLASFQFNPKS